MTKFQLRGGRPRQTGSFSGGWQRPVRNGRLTWPGAPAGGRWGTPTGSRRPAGVLSLGTTSPLLRTRAPAVNGGTGRQQKSDDVTPAVNGGTGRQQKSHDVTPAVSGGTGRHRKSRDPPPEGAQRPRLAGGSEARADWEYIWRHRNSRGMDKVHTKTVIDNVPDASSYSPILLIF